jgi:anti-anti-sigma factor
MDVQNDPISVTRIADGCHVAILGPIHTNVAWLESAFAKIIAAKPKVVELDLAKMPFTSSLGLGVLVSFRNAVAGYGGDLTTVAVNDHVLKTIKFAYLQGLLKIGPTTAVVKSES